MNSISVIAIITILVFLFVYAKYLHVETTAKVSFNKSKVWKEDLIWLLSIALIVKLIFAISYIGHESDVNCFLSWADLAYQKGFSNFYSSEVFTDYPPGYIYVLYVLGAIKNIFHIANFSSLSIMLIKLPAILCDLWTGYIIYKVAIKRFSNKSALICTLLYVFNPAVVFNSSIWGQVDSVYTLLIVLMCYYIMEKKLKYAYFAFAIGILIKPQALIFAPVLIYGIVDQIFLDDFTKKKFFNHLFTGIGAIMLMVLLMVPFGFTKVVSQYLSTLTSYPYASFNAYNFWTMIGFNCVPQETRFLFLSCKMWGNIAILVIVIVGTILSLRCKKERSKYFFIAAFIIATMFLFSVRMHERYLFPVMIFLLLAFLLKPRKELFILYTLFSVAQFYNTAHVLFNYDPYNFSNKAVWPILISIFTLLIYLYLLYVMKKYYNHYDEKEEKEFFGKSIKKADEDSSLDLKKTSVEIRPSIKAEKLTKWDILIILSITIIYAAIAFFDLGDHEIPSTAFESNTKGENITIDLGKNQEVTKINYFLGNYEEREFVLSVSNDLNSEFIPVTTFKMNSVFAWGSQEVNVNARYLRLTSNSDKAVIRELVLLGKDQKPIIPVIDATVQALFDEQDLYPERSTFRNGTYFDEIYHARTAYEYMNGLYSYENTHPPLGKIFIALGMKLFGVNPFGWRFMGTLFGVLMIPFIYLFARRAMRKTWIATIVTLLFAFDFMHFTQTRIATIDVFVTFFIILMYYFMYQYTRLSFYDTSLKKTFLPLGLSGIFMGFGMASKWTGVYAGVGLAIIFFLTMFRRYKEYRYALQNKTGSSYGISHEIIVTNFTKNFWKTIAFCVGFFVIIPAIIYTLSYLPFVATKGQGLIERMLYNQQTMLSYHTHVDATHPYSSWWYQWPIIYRPIWYYSGTVSDTIKEGISAFGNPLVWWMGIPAFFYTLYLGIKEKSQTAWFLVIGYLAEYLPWMFVTRITFIYHYFPSVPFVTLMLGFVIYKLVEKHPKLKIAAFIYVALAIVLFIIFYPVLSGAPVNADFVHRFLRWMDSWVLVA